MATVGARHSASSPHGSRIAAPSAASSISAASEATRSGASLPRVSREIKLWTIKTLAEYLKEVINKTRNIFGAFTQGRHVQ